ncbi:MAG: chemotaxis response regulator protein-glutamate methylesterase [Oscillospiraceae bacterium]|nr:chemotaxis response regulator protein-glutamate methylesterase [Oscillospiraceae bacterium]MCL2279183.1 chemotaxis response regulator protein-glutamate methylesterase [Oscillospiraceae bacterium]
MPKIRLMIVDDSLFFRTFLTTQLGREQSIEIVGSFGSPVDASSKIAALRPDVIALDMEMPRMRGDEFLRTVIPKHRNVKVIVISALSENVFDAMQAGAIDFVGKPGSTPGFDEKQFVNEIIEKIKIAAQAHIRTREDFARARPSTTRPGMPVRTTRVLGATSKNIIAIGASTGGTEAIIEVIKNFPASTPGVVIVQHMPPGFTKMYADRVNKLCAMTVREAKNTDRVTQGTILIAPGGDDQMSLRQDSQGYYVKLEKGPKVSGHCPSVDVLFSSVAKLVGKHAVGVILTGMGSDGARGLVEMKSMGAHTIGQDEASCVVYGMPMEAFKRGGVKEQLPLSAIGDAVLRQFSGRR